MRAVMLRLVPSLLVLVAAGCSLAEQCMPQEDNPCVARCSNDTVLDISKLFHFPYAWSMLGVALNHLLHSFPAG